MKIRCLTARAILIPVGWLKWMGKHDQITATGVIVAILWTMWTACYRQEYHYPWWRAILTPLVWSTIVVLVLVSFIIAVGSLVCGCINAVNWAKRTAEECRTENNHL